ncbi:MAG: C10 family peptidase [Treponema sp.]|nr:C10 family peptidase [Treponema sp.]
MLKNLAKKYLLNSFLFISFFILGCKNISDDKKSLKIVSSFSERKDQLIEIALTGNWKSADQEVQNEILSIFKNENRTVNNSFIKINKINESSISIPVSFNESRSAIIEECNEINFDLYSIETDKEKWHAVASDDKRIGNVLALIESEFLEDISDNDFSIMFAECLNNYVLNTAEQWNSITDEDICDYKSRSVYKDIVNDNNYTYSSWIKNSGNTKCQLPVNWNQNPSPFNNCLVSVKGGNAYYIGCGAIQVAQIMAYHKYAKINISPNLKKIKEKWALASNWNGKYDFDILTSIKRPYSNCPEDLKIQLGAFLFDVADGCKSEYGTNGTSTYENNRINYLKQQGYKYDSTSDYSFKHIKASIDAGYPVPICGQSKKHITKTNHKFLWWTWTTTNTSYSGGHAFIIDGYYNMSCTATNGITTITITDNFVHCNPGWGGSYNGYYLNGVLNFGNGELIDDSDIRSVEGEDLYYQYKLHQINFLRPSGE